MGEKKGIHYAWFIMASCSAFAFCVLGIVMSCAGIFFKPVCDALGISRAAISMYLTIFYLTMVVCLPIAGKLVPKHFKPMLIAGMAVFTLTFAAMSQFTSLYHWYIAGVLLGISGSIVIYLPIPNLINNWFKKRVGFALGFSLAMSGVGGAIFNPLGAWIIENYGWRTGYLVLGLFAAIVTLTLAVFVVRQKPSDIGWKPYGAEEVAEVQAAQTQTAAVKELPGLTSGKALKTVTFYTAFIFTGMLIMTSSVQTHLPGYIATVGLSPVVGGVLLTFASIGIIFGKLSLGFLNDKIGLSGAVTTGCTIGILGLLAILLGPTTLPLLYGGGFLYGFGLTAMCTVLPPLIVRQFFGQRDFSSIYSNITSGATLLQALSVTLFGLIYDLTKSYAFSLILGLIFIVVAYFAYLITKATGKKLLADNT